MAPVSAATSTSLTVTPNASFIALTSFRSAGFDHETMDKGTGQIVTQFLKTVLKMNRKLHILSLGTLRVPLNDSFLKKVVSIILRSMINNFHRRTTTVKYSRSSLNGALAILKIIPCLLMWDDGVRDCGLVCLWTLLPCCREFRSTPYERVS